MERLLNRWIERGNLVGPLPSAAMIRQRVLDQLRWIGRLDEPQSPREPAPKGVEERATGAVVAASTVAA
jgi:hypothetical protein